jgi:hypothetical protein
MIFYSLVVLLSSRFPFYDSERPKKVDIGRSA